MLASLRHCLLERVTSTSTKALVARPVVVAEADEGRRTASEEAVKLAGQLALAERRAALALARTQELINAHEETLSENRDLRASFMSPYAGGAVLALSSIRSIHPF